MKNIVSKSEFMEILRSHGYDIVGVEIKKDHVVVSNRFTIEKMIEMMKQQNQIIKGVKLDEKNQEVIIEMDAPIPPRRKMQDTNLT